MDYVPTQYLAELVLDLGYDGLVYGSGFDPNGENLVLFDTGVATVEEVDLVFVEDTRIEWNRYLP